MVVNIDKTRQHQKSTGINLFCRQRAIIRFGSEADDYIVSYGKPGIKERRLIRRTAGVQSCCVADQKRRLHFHGVKGSRTDDRTYRCCAQTRSSAIPWPAPALSKAQRDAASASRSLAISSNRQVNLSQNNAALPGRPGFSRVPRTRKPPR